MRDKALSHHTAGVAGLRDEMASGRLDGSEDWVLATINGLTLFDVSVQRAICCAQLKTYSTIESRPKIRPREIRETHISHDATLQC
jgi:hypothetical protein